MNISEILLIGLALSMDAFAVAISCGLKIDRAYSYKMFKVALFFGLFQAVMPIIGYFFGTGINGYIAIKSNWISFVIFLVLGLKSLKETFEKKESSCGTCICLGFKCILMLSLATSIDAFLVGIVFSVKHVNIWLSVLIIGVVTFVISIFGAFMGHYLSSHWGKRSGYLASILLIFLAFKELFWS